MRGAPGRGPGRRARALLLVALAGGLALPAAAEVRREEAVGVVAIGAEARPRSQLREAALHAGIAEAVRRVATQLLQTEASHPPDLDAEALYQILGKPMDYTVRFRVLDDYGERAPQLVTAPDATAEYVVVAEVHVDVEKVRRALQQADLLAPEGGPGSIRRLTVVLEPLDSYRALEWLQERLQAQHGVDAATPVEVERGRAVLAVATWMGPDELWQRLASAAPPGARIVRQRTEDGLLALSIDLPPPAPAPD